MNTPKIVPTHNVHSTPNLHSIRTAARDYVNPVDYRHPHDSMRRFAELLALRYDANRTLHAYYRQLRLIHEHFQCDPASLTEGQLRDWFLHVKLHRQWRPRIIYLSVYWRAGRRACARC